MSIRALAILCLLWLVCLVICVVGFGYLAARNDKDFHDAP